jgi:hypothetical protein
MTALEMKAQFLALYDAATSLAAPGWENTEISSFLNTAQLDIIREAVTNSRYDLISTIITDTSAIVSLTLVTDTLIKNSYTYDLTLTTDYLYYISSQSKYTRTSPTLTSDYVYNEEIDYRQAAQFVASPFNKPYFRIPKCFLTNKKLRVLCDFYTTVIALIVTYVKIPAIISIDGIVPSNINEALHQDIVKRAVDVAVESIKKAKISTQ